MKKRFCGTYNLLPVGLAVCLSLFDAWTPRLGWAEEPPAAEVPWADVAAEPGTWSGTNPELDQPTPHGPNHLLYDNGAFTTGIDDGCGTQSPRNTSQIELNHTTPGFTGGANPGGPGENFRLADDFVVPNGQHWMPTQLKWYAYQTQVPGFNPPTNTLTGMNVQIWSGTPGAGGSVVAGNPSTIVPLTSSIFSGAYRVSGATLTNCQRAIIELTADLTQLSPPIPPEGLAPGTYWVDVQCVGSLIPAASVFCPPTVPSHQGGDQDNGRQSPDDGIAWGATGDAGDLSPVDFPFKLYGEPGPSKSPSVFTYQGRLSNSSGGLNGLADLKFTVHYSETGNFAAGPPSQVDNVPVNDGLFTANVDLPADINPELFWWLEIDVRHPAGSGSFVALAPRQRITTTPRARFADTCNLLSDSAQFPWSQLTGVPFGFADGIDSEGPWNMHPGGALYYNNSIAIGNLVPTARLHIGGVAGTDGIRFPDNTLQTTAGSPVGHAHSSLNASDGSPANALALDAAGNVGIGTPSPLTTLHASNLNLSIPAAALENDDLIVESLDATLGLYSDQDGTWSSAIAMKEMDGGLLVDTWGIARQTSTSGSELAFTYGTSNNYANNPTVLGLGNGVVGVNTLSPLAELHVSGVASDTLSKILVTPGIANSSSEIQLSENTSATIGFIMRYEGATTNQLQLIGLAAGPTESVVATFDRDNLAVAMPGSLTVTGSISATSAVVTQTGGEVARFNRLASDGIIVGLHQDSIQEGAISVAGTTVSYGAFTGSHYGWTDCSIARGSLVVMTGANRRRVDDPGSEPIYGIAPSTMPNDPRCLGAYLGVLEPEKPHSLDNPHQVMAVGNGDMWVVDSGRDIQPGDYLISSDVEGHAMLDDAGRFPIGHVIARAAEGVDWSRVTDRDAGRRHLRITVFFESFERGNSAGLAKLVERQQAELDALRARNAELNARLNRIEALLTDTVDNSRAAK